MPRGRPKKTKIITNQLLGLNESQKECLEKTVESIQAITSCYSDLYHPSIDDIINLDRIGWELRNQFKEYMKDE
tara:strand:+ start:6003 stop:6224 length:222 start_codon:yes stop_codon:yes gene_type:complete